MNMSNITFQVLRLSTFVFNKCSELIIFTIKFGVNSLKGFGWNNIGPASQTVVQHHISIGPMYRAIWCFGRRDFKGHLVSDGGGSNTRRRHLGLWPMRKTNTLIFCL